MTSIPSLLAEIQKRCDAATPAPWDDASKYPNIKTVRIFAKSRYVATVGNAGDSREQTEANAAFIAHSRTDVERLVKALERANATFSAIIEIDRITGTGKSESAAKDALNHIADILTGTETPTI